MNASPYSIYKSEIKCQCKWASPSYFVCCVLVLLFFVSFSLCPANSILHQVQSVKVCVVCLFYLFFSSLLLRFECFSNAISSQIFRISICQLRAYTHTTTGQCLVGNATLGRLLLLFLFITPDTFAGLLFYTIKCKRFIIYFFLESL